MGDKPQVLGQHFYVPNPRPTAGGPATSPKWDFTSDSERGKSDAFVIAASVGTLLAPNSKDDINWVQLKKIEGQLAGNLYRVDTKGGQPPTSVSSLRHDGSKLLSLILSALLGLYRFRSSMQPNIVGSTSVLFQYLLIICYFVGLFGGEFGR